MTDVRKRKVASLILELTTAVILLGLAAGIAAVAYPF